MLAQFKAVPSPTQGPVVHETQRIDLSVNGILVVDYDLTPDPTPVNPRAAASVDIHRGGALYLTVYADTPAQASGRAARLVMLLNAAGISSNGMDGE